MLEPYDNPFWDFMQKCQREKERRNAQYNGHIVGLLAQALRSDQFTQRLWYSVVYLPNLGKKTLFI